MQKYFLGGIVFLILLIVAILSLDKKPIAPESAPLPSIVNEEIQPKTKDSSVTPSEILVEENDLSKQKIPSPQSPEDEESVTCTADARLCPDGSAVGRVGTDCSFAPCPGSLQENLDTTTSIDKKEIGETLPVPKSGRCVYNQAYQENYEADSIPVILAEAKGCYVLIDPFDNLVARQQIAAIKQKDNTVGCYISIGTAEDWRDDFEKLEPYVAKNAWGEWEGEYFVSEISDELIDTIKERLDTLAGWGCDMVEYDNMDWGADYEYVEEYNLEVDAYDSQMYAEGLCAYTHQLGMECMAKSTTYNSSIFDGATYESYPTEKNWWDNSDLQEILDTHKLGIIVHYDENDCESVYDFYVEQYGPELSFICENKSTKNYQHFGS